MRIILIFLWLSLPFAAAHSQDAAALANAEIGMKALLEGMRNAPGESERMDLNNRFAAALSATLEGNGAFTYPFDSLKGITMVISPDRRFRLFTWPALLSDGRYLYSGILMVQDKKEKTARITLFTDRGDSITDPGKAILPPENWFGAVYYQVIPVKVQDGSTAYTLLGWRGLGLLVSSRIIEIMTIGNDGSVTFGSTLFCDKERLPDSRIIFRYSAKASMVLAYEKQAMLTGRKWNPSSREFETDRIREMMIVCDRMLPSDPQMEGRYEYYFPSSDVMDGYLFSDGCWTIVREVDARNPYQKPKPLPKNPDK
jgi:hypothetical protein